MTDTVIPLDDATPYLTGNFAPVTEEVTATELPVIGEIPVELEGRMLRNGPNPIDTPDPAAHHWFVGDGMVHGVRLRGGRAEWYRNRWVGSERTVELLGRTDHRQAVGTLGPNTNVVGHGGRTYALVEAGTQPVELTYELETMATNPFGGTLQNGFTAHPKYDPLTGEMHAVAYAPETLFDIVQYVVVDANGAVTKTIPISLPTMPMIHDMALTQRYAVVFDFPVAVDLEMVAGGTQFPFRWFDEYPTRLGLLDRDAEDADGIIWCEMDPSFAFHPMNSYDLPDGRVVIDICRFERMFVRDLNGPFRDSAAVLERWTVDPERRTVDRQLLSDRPQEFPRVATSVLNTDYRYGYAASTGSDPNLWAFGPTLKHDLQAGTVEEFDHGPGRGGAEPVFVRKADSSAEDAGWVITFVYDQTTETSELVIMDAQDFGRGAVARVQLPQRVPIGFHGNWVPDSVTPPPG